MIGEKVTHEIFGEGVISSVDTDKNLVSVVFGKRTLCFPYPDSFRGYLTAVDLDLQKSLQEESKNQ